MMCKKSGKQKHCRNELSFHSFKILIFFSLYLKWWLKTWNISSQHANNIHDVFLHGALNVKTWFSHGVFWTGYKTNKQQQKTPNISPNKNTHEKKQTRRCQRRSGRKFDSIYKRSSRVRKMSPGLKTDKSVLTCGQRSGFSCSCDSWISSLAHL